MRERRELAASCPVRAATMRCAEALAHARHAIYMSSVERWRRYELWLGELRELALDV